MKKELKITPGIFPMPVLMIGTYNEDGSVDVMNAAWGMAQEMNEAAISVGQLATQTGIAEPEMVNLINTISNATFPNDEAMMYVKSLDQIGVASSNLGQSATDLDRINDAFGLGQISVGHVSIDDDRDDGVSIAFHTSREKHGQ